MRVLYLDCFSGISGDMLLASLLDLGARVRVVRESVKDGLKLDFSLRVERVEVNAMTAKRVKVSPKGRPVQRNYAQIKDMIEGSDLNDEVKRIALDAFRRLAEAEAKIHGCAIDDVHFHEVGAVDSIVDIVGSAVAVVELRVGRVVASPLPLSRGFVDTQHGTLPLPAPATLEILKGAPTYGDARTHELVTPTGAALVRALASEFGEFPQMRIAKVGYGAGKHEDDRFPNLLRAVLGEDEFGTDRVWVIECDIDDQSPELFPPLLEKLMNAGALDVSVVQALGKKGRPKFVLCALAHAGERDSVIRTMLDHSSTLGIRYHQAERRMLDRREVAVEVDGVRVRIKLGISAGTIAKLKPEFEDCKRLAAAAKIPLAAAFQKAIAAASSQGLSVGKKI